MRIGLLGGTFDPIHNGHLQVAEAVLSRLKLDRVFFIPTGGSPHKQDGTTTSRRHRREMVSLALKDYPLFTLCDIEIKSARISYTVDTIATLKHLYPEDTFFFIIGTDAFSHLSEWKAPERLLPLSHFVIVPRIGTPFLQLPILPALQAIDRKALRALTREGRRAYIFVNPSPPNLPSQGSHPLKGRDKNAIHLTFLSMPPMRISASHIRARIKDQKSVVSLLPKNVLSYIMEKGIYTKRGATLAKEE